MTYERRAMETELSAARLIRERSSVLCPRSTSPTGPPSFATPTTSSCALAMRQLGIVKAELPSDVLAASREALGAAAESQLDPGPGFGRLDAAGGRTWRTMLRGWWTRCSVMANAVRSRWAGTKTTCAAWSSKRRQFGRSD